MKPFCFDLIPMIRILNPFYFSLILFCSKLCFDFIPMIRITKEFCFGLMPLIRMINPFYFGLSLFWSKCCFDLIPLIRMIKQFCFGLILFYHNDEFFWLDSYRVTYDQYVETFLFWLDSFFIKMIPMISMIPMIIMMKPFYFLSSHVRVCEWGATCWQKFRLNFLSTGNVQLWKCFKCFVFYSFIFSLFF